MQTLQTAITRDGLAVQGIGFAVLSYASFSTADAIIKLTSGRFSVFQIAFTVALFALLPVAFLTRGRGGWRALVPKLWRLVAVLDASLANVVHDDQRHAQRFAKLADGAQVRANNHQIAGVLPGQHEVQRIADKHLDSVGQEQLLQRGQVLDAAEPRQIERPE